MKVALIHDGIITKGGAERVFLYFCQAFPEADIYSSVYYPDNAFPEFRDHKIRTSWYNWFTKNEFSYRNLFFPFGVLASRSIDLTDYDVVLQSTTTGAKYARVSKNAKVISYIHQPFRLVWSPESYEQVRNASWIKRWVISTVVSFMRSFDFKAIERSDIIISNSINTSKKILEVYGRNSDFIIKPPINCSDFYVSSKVEDYFLVVSRFEPYKKVDLVIRAFNKLGLPLKVVGNGTQRKYLKSIAGSNIEFYHNLGQSELSRLYSHARALVFPQEEDYGITPLEAVASGRPVIGYNKGGLLETMIPYCGDARSATALFFDEQNEESIIAAVEQFNGLEFDSGFIKRYSERFDVPFFKDKIRSIVFENEN